MYSEWTQRRRIKKGVGVEIKAQVMGVRVKPIMFSIPYSTCAIIEVNAHILIDHVLNVPLSFNDGCGW